MNHDIPEETLNSDLAYCINEYVRLVEHRKILRDWWFHGATLESLSADYHISVTAVKKIVYTIGDPILLRASALSEKRYKRKKPGAG